MIGKEQTLKNIKAVLEASGSDFSKIVKLNVYLKNYADFVPMNEVYITHFGYVKPVSVLPTVNCLTAAKKLSVIGTHLRCGPGPAVQCDR
jgi:enamine deaminase RidA (YjgF/YER057c/UK114 family)